MTTIRKTFENRNFEEKKIRTTNFDFFFSHQDLPSSHYYKKKEMKNRQDNLSWALFQIYKYFRAIFRPVNTKKTNTQRIFWREKNVRGKFFLEKNWNPHDKEEEFKTRRKKILKNSIHPFLLQLHLITTSPEKIYSGLPILNAFFTTYRRYEF